MGLRHPVCDICVCCICVWKEYMYIEYIRLLKESVRDTCVGNESVRAMCVIYIYMYDTYIFQ